MSPIFCKFDHETTLEAKGRHIRFYRGGSDISSFDYHLASASVFCAVNLYEGVVHILTTDGVLEITADHDVGIIFKKIGPKIP